jgi:hypothetical protein
LLGVGSGWNSRGPQAREKAYEHWAGFDIHRRYVHGDRGTVHLISVPDEVELRRYSIAVAENNHMRLQGAELATAAPQEKPDPSAPPRPIPERAGEPSTIDHVVYIIKENRSYDQCFGSLGKGNGDPSLDTYQDDIIPNQRKLVRDYVLLDNFFANGGNSADGHQWVTQAAETDYTHWPGYNGRSYPKNGDDPLGMAGSGFLWDHLPAHHKSFADFGEYVGEIGDTDVTLRSRLIEQYRQGSHFSGTLKTKAPIAKLNQFLAPDYPAYSINVPDVVRARIFLRHLKAWEDTGDMPNLVLMQLPSDATEGTTPGATTPRADIADKRPGNGRLSKAFRTPSSGSRRSSSSWKMMRRTDWITSTVTEPWPLQSARTSGVEASIPRSIRK